jgi:prevent-host-death family protein
MTQVGIRDLKNGLSAYLKRVCRGETVVVTDRGRPVAQISPLGVPDDILRLEAAGRITWLGGHFERPKRTVRLKAGPPLSSYIAEERR